MGCSCWLPVSIEWVSVPACVSGSFGTRFDNRKVRAMQPTALTFKSIRARPVVLKLRRPVVAHIATIADWPLILIDLYTNEGIVGRSYLEPYVVKSMKYLLPAVSDFG